MTRVGHVFAALAVGDLAESIAWYERLFGRPPDMRPNENEVVWRLTETSSAYVVVDGHRAGGGVMTLIVDDLGEVVRELAGRGLDPAVRETIPGVGRKASFDDPAGNRIAFAELEPGPQP